MILMKKFFSLKTVAIEIGKRHFFQWLMKNVLIEKVLHQKHSLRDANYHWKNWVDCKLDTWWDKTLQPQNCTFSEKELKKLKKNIIILHFMTTLKNAAYKTEVGFELKRFLRPL